MNQFKSINLHGIIKKIAKPYRYLTSILLVGLFMNALVAETAKNKMVIYKTIHSVNQNHIRHWPSNRSKILFALPSDANNIIATGKTKDVDGEAWAQVVYERKYVGWIEQSHLHRTGVIVAENNLADVRAIVKQSKVKQGELKTTENKAPKLTNDLSQTVASEDSVKADTEEQLIKAEETKAIKKILAGDTKKTPEKETLALKPDVAAKASSASTPTKEVETTQQQKTNTIDMNNPDQLLDLEKIDDSPIQMDMPEEQNLKYFNQASDANPAEITADDANK